MTSLKMYQVDAFTSRIFGGNPAAVLLLDAFLPDEVMQSIAIENNLSETAFAVARAGGWDLRWFTPGGEVDLCGHATLATAHILATEYGVEGDMEFETRSGQLRVELLANGRYLMDMPADHGQGIDVPKGAAALLGCPVVDCLEGKDDYLLVIDDVALLRAAKWDFSELDVGGKRGWIVTAASQRVAFESRCYYPDLNIAEDPVTGSAHTLLTPYWAYRLRQNAMDALQVSPRVGELHCVYKGKRVALMGSAATFMRGEISF